MKLAFSNDGDLQEVMYHVNCRQWHNTERELLSKYIKSGQTLIDVGANIGFMAVIMSDLAGPSGNVLCFEPSKRIFEKLKRTVALNGLANVRLYNQGCGANRSKGSLFTLSESSGNSSMLEPNHNSNLGREPVDLVSLDEELLPNESLISFIKIDVEGYEPSVLKGAIQILRSHRPTIYIELCTEYAASSAEAIQILRENGYAFVPEPDLKTVNGTNFIAFHKDQPKTGT
jgi:FkbM family methyltransferase